MNDIDSALTQLNTGRNRLSDNLNTMGVTSSRSETLAALVPKVLDISTGASGEPFSGIAEHNITKGQNALAIRSRGWVDYLQRLALPGTFHTTMLSAAFSADGKIMAIVGGTVALGGQMYAYNTSTGEHLGADGSTVGEVNAAVAVAPNGNIYVGYSGNVGYIGECRPVSGRYKTVGNFSDYSYTGGTAPNVNDLKFSPDGRYLAAALSAAPGIAIWEWTGTGLSAQLPNPSVLPGGSSSCLAWSPDGRYLAVGHSTGDRVTIYDVDAGFVKIPTDAGMRPDIGQIYSVAFNRAGDRLAFGGQNSPFIVMCSFADGTLTHKHAAPTAFPPARVNGVCFSHDSSQLLLAHNTSPFASLYRITDDALTDYTSLAATGAGTPAGNANGVAVSPDGRLAIIPHATAPFCSMYKTYMEDTVTTGTLEEFGGHLLSGPGAVGLGKASVDTPQGGMASMDILLSK